MRIPKALWVTQSNSNSSLVRAERADAGADLIMQRLVANSSARVAPAPEKLDNFHRPLVCVFDLVLLILLLSPKLASSFSSLPSLGRAGLRSPSRTY